MTAPLNPAAAREEAMRSARGLAVALVLLLCVAVTVVVVLVVWWVKGGA